LVTEKEYKPLRFSRVPIYKDSKDNVTGFVLRSELLAKLVNDEDSLLLKDLIRPLMITNESMPVPLLGLEIIDEMDNADDMQMLARKNWEKRAKELGIISPEGKED